MRILMAIGLGLFVATSVGAESTPSDAYFPLEKGTVWVYDTLHKSKKDHFDMTVTIEGPWSVMEADGKIATLEGMVMKQNDKRGQMREFLMRNEKGVFIHKLGLSKKLTPEVFTKFTPPVPRVIYPLETGTKVHWEGRLKVAWVNKPIIFDGIVQGFEEIEVPAGKFKCIKLFYDQKRGDEKVQETAWYAEGVGQVKYDGGEYVKELKSFKPAK